ncbi:MAG TPA: protein kinase [Gemmatimonadaceae bacterium]
MNLLHRLRSALEERYLIEGEAGAGGMATVYVARDVRHQRRVALKVLHPDLGAMLGADRFLAEIRVTASLQHPNLLPLFDSGEVDGLLYYVMPFVEGETLRARLERERQLPVEEAVRIAVAVTSALDYAHQLGVIHRDLKPENILLQQGQPVVADFGIALAVSNASGSRLTQTGLSLGTPAYMSPEQATGDAHIDGRADIYSLGAVVYEMLAGVPPHAANSAQAVIARILTERPASVRMHRPTVPPHVDTAVARALEKLPADRFSTAREFADALEGRAAPLPTYGTFTSAAAAWNSRARGFRRVQNSPWWIVAFAASAVVAIWALASRPDGTGVATDGIRRFRELLPEVQGFFSDVGVRLAISPDGRRIAFVGPGANPDATRLWVRSLDDLHPRSVEGTDGAGSPAFSPDGEWLAFITFTRASRRVLRIVPVAGGGAVTLADSGVGQSGVSWGKDGYVYFDSQGRDAVKRVPENGGAAEVISRTDSARRELGHFQPNVLPNGRAALITIRRSGGLGEYEVAVVDLESREVHVLGPGIGAWYARSGHLLILNPAGTLLAAPFDLDRLAIAGAFVPVATGLSVSQFGIGDVAVSETGVLTYAAGRNLTGNRELVWVTRDGSVSRVDSSWRGFFGGRVRLSPDGRTLATTREGSGTAQHVWVKHLDQGPAMRLAEVGATDAGWSPDGRTLAFGSSGGVWIGPADGSVPPRRLFQTASPARRPEFTPDGAWLVYDIGAALFAHRIRGDSTTRELVRSGAGTTAPAISPGGRWLAYNSTESGRFEVYLRPFPNVDSLKRKISVNGGLSPRWSRDGRELFFLDSRQDMVVVPIRTEPTITIGEPRRLFGAADFTYPGGPGFDVSPDGQRFLMTRLVATAGGPREELIVVQNFFEELRAKVRPRQ